MVMGMRRGTSPRSHLLVFVAPRDANKGRRLARDGFTRQVVGGTAERVIWFEKIHQRSLCGSVPLSSSSNFLSIFVEG